MKSIYKYLAHAGLSAAVCVALALPAMAQRGGGGGGHSGGGGGGGGHFGGGGGGGFSGGSHVSGGFSGSRPSGGFSGARPSGGFSGARPSGGFSGSRPSFSGGRSGAVVSRGGSYAGRPSFGARAGAVAPRGYVRSVTATNVGGGRALANRGYVSGGGVYGHSYTGGGIYARPYAWGSHGGYFYTHGYYGLDYYPWLGFSCGYLPYGYYPFWWGDAYYYYNDGLFYSYDNDQYTVVEPPVGAEVDKLPAKAQSIVIDGQQYYEYNGVYYEAITKDDGSVAYQVAGKDGVLNTNASGADAVMPKVGDVTYTLPEGAKKLKLNGQVLFVTDDGIYYQEFKDPSGKKAYKITAIETPDQQ
ncbi:MAG: hypothetical protein JSU01_23030 [Bacteroidetes bacterium]|nr:hypothetical protein [Bacteroidota bacterium]